MIRVLILTALLSGCIIDEYDYNITNPDVVYVGDSLCWKVFDTDEGMDNIYDDESRWKTAEREAGIITNCVPGRKLTDIDSLPERSNGHPWRVLFLALGTNDVGRTTIDELSLHYQALVDSVEIETLYCVLPNRVIHGVDAEPYRQAIREICANVIDPLEYGVRFRAKDTVHKTKADQPGWWIAIIDRITLH